MAVDGAESGAIVVEGPATIYEVSALRESLREALGRARDLTVDLGDSGKWDLAGLQLLVSCVNAAHDQGGSVRLLRVPTILREVAERSGLTAWLDSVSV